MDNITFLFSNTSLIFSIFIIAAIAGMISERAGVINVAIEGYMIIGGLTFSITGSLMNSDSQHGWTQILAILFAAIVCALFSMLQSLASIKLKANQIVAGTAINILAQGIGLYLATSSFFGTEATSITSNYLTMKFDGDKGIFTLYLVIAIVIAGVVGLYFTFTKVGIRHAATGENPNAIDAAGISVVKYRWGAAAMSGALAGIAGSIYVVGMVGGRFYGSTDGWGFLALAIMIVGQWRVKYISLGAFAFAIFFALSRSAGIAIDMGSWINSNTTLFKAVPFIISILIMVAFAKWSKPPKASGVPYDKSKR